MSYLIDLCGTNKLLSIKCLALQNVKINKTLYCGTFHCFFTNKYQILQKTCIGTLGQNILSKQDGRFFFTFIKKSDGFAHKIVNTKHIIGQ